MNNLLPLNNNKIKISKPSLEIFGQLKIELNSHLCKNLKKLDFAYLALNLISLILQELKI